MKQIVSLSLFLIFNLLLVNHCILSKSTMENKSNLKSKTKSKAGANAVLGQSLDALKRQWKTLFSTERGNSCTTNEVFTPDVSSDNDPSSQAEADAKKSGWGVIKPSTRWIKKWGFNGSAYLFDFLEPVFKQDFIKEAQSIIKDISKIKKDDNEVYQDAFNMKFIAPKGNNLSSDADFKAISKSFSKTLHDLSVNTVQLNTIFNEWSWFNSGDGDHAYDMVAKYDINGDGRLSYRELILANIWNNKKRDDLYCYNCFFLLAKKIAAMFAYLDCQGKGYLTSEDLWRKLPSLVRGTNQCNIFSISTNNSIRTDATNDFILKNGYTVDAGVTRNEFITGILLGFWDRIVQDDKIVLDDSMSMKTLRWANGGLADIRANQYLLDNPPVKK